MTERVTFVVGAIASLWVLGLGSVQIWQENEPPAGSCDYKVDWIYRGSIRTQDGKQKTEEKGELLEWERDLLEQNAVDGETVELWLSPFPLRSQSTPVVYRGSFEDDPLYGRTLIDERNGFYYVFRYPDAETLEEPQNWRKS